AVTSSLSTLDSAPFSQNIILDIRPPSIGSSAEDLKNEVSFLTETKGGGAAGSISTNSELKAAYDFRNYKWIPTNDDGVVLLDPPSYGDLAYPVTIMYNRSIAYSDSKNRTLTIAIHGVVNFTPEQWQKEIGPFNIDKLPPMRLLILRGK